MPMAPKPVAPKPVVLLTEAELLDRPETDFIFLQHFDCQQGREAIEYFNGICGWKLLGCIALEIGTFQ